MDGKQHEEKVVGEAVDAALVVGIVFVEVVGFVELAVVD